MRLFLFFLGITFIFMPRVSLADAVPMQMQGLWAIPDCKTPEQHVYHTKNHVLYLTKEDAQLKYVTAAPSQHDYAVFTIRDQEYPVKHHNDGILEIGILAEGYAVNPEREWSALPIDQRREYTKCAEDLPSPHTLADNALKLADAKQSLCTDDYTGACQKALFNAADTNGNGVLESDEQHLALLTHAYLERLASSRSPIRTERFYRLPRPNVSQIESSLAPENARAFLYSLYVDYPG